MDPSILKLLEEDEDESMHSIADLDAFQAALNRDIEGNNHSPSQQLATWKSGIGDANINLQTQSSLESIQMKEQQGPALENQNQHDLKRANESHLQRSLPQDLHREAHIWESPSQVSQTTGSQVYESEISHNQESESQYMNLQNMSSQQAQPVDQPVYPMNHNLNRVPFGALLTTLTAPLDKDRSLQLHTLYSRLKKNEIHGQEFIRHAKDIVGDHMLRLAVSKLLKMNNNQGKMGIQAPSTEINKKKSQPDPRGIHLNQLPSSNSGTLSSPIPVQRPPRSILMYTSSGSSHSYSDASGSSLRPHLHDSHNRDNQTRGSTGLGRPGQSTTNMMTTLKFERQPSINDSNRVQGGAASHFENNSSFPLNSAPGQGSSMFHVKQESLDQSFHQNNSASGTSNEDLEESCGKFLSTPSNMMHASSDSPSMTTQLDANTAMNSRGSPGTSQAGSTATMPPKKPSVGQKKPLETLGSSPPPASKKQKVVGNFMDQSIEELNDVTAVSCVNLREEEEQLFSGGKKDGGVSEAYRRVVHEEEERLFLQKSPLQKKLAEIMAKFGLKHISNDVKPCLSLCVEERMRGLLSRIIRLSKQRIDVEKSKHRTIITSDIWLQIREMNQKVKEEWEKKEAEAEKLKKPSEVCSELIINAVNSEKEKGDNRSKRVKGNKDDDEKVRTAANVAVRAAVGGDDTFLKWQLMAKARQKSVCEAVKDGNQKGSWGGLRNSKDRQDDGRRFSGAGGGRQGKNQGSLVRRITVKDVVAVLEREPHMSKSILTYRLIQ